MKTIISKDLKNRINFAAENGSKIANIIMTELRQKANRNVQEVLGESHANYFDSTRVVKAREANVKYIEVKITYCCKDLDNSRFPDAGNPDAPYFPENRTSCNPAKFARMFKAVDEAESRGEIEESDWGYFDSAIRCASKVTLLLSDRMADIVNAYKEENYTGVAEYGCSTLQNSCMRHSVESRNAADFYAHVAGASILVAKNAEGEVLGRAMIWNDLTCKRNDVGIIPDAKMSLMERTYFSYNFLLFMMRDYVQKRGVLLRKTHNDYSHLTEMTVLNDIVNSDGIVVARMGDVLSMRLCKDIPAVKWHKNGAPYCDTFKYLMYDETTRGLMLANYPISNMHCVANLQYTGGIASRQGFTICPICGKVHTNSSYPICDNCASEHMHKTIFGQQFVGKMKSYKGQYIPVVAMENGKPNVNCQNFMAIEKLFTK